MQSFKDYFKQNKNIKLAQPEDEEEDKKEDSDKQQDHDDSGDNDDFEFDFNVDQNKGDHIDGKDSDSEDKDDQESGNNDDDDQSEDKDDQESDDKEEPKDDDQESQDKTPDDAKDGDKDKDPNRQGLIRTVKNAHLVYKRQDEDGTYDELWIYNIGKGFRDEYDIRNDILAGTDIPPKDTQSRDGSQTYTLWTMGNAQLINITGLPN